MKNSEFRDLLIVSHNEALYVVEAPSYEACEGDLVEFAPVSDSMPVLGEVVDKAFLAEYSDEYRCISKLLPIHPARRIYKIKWEAWEGEDEPGGQES